MRAYSRRGDVWAKLGSYKKSIEDNSKAFSIVAEELGPENPNSKSYRSGIGYAYYLQGKHKEALPHFNAAIEAYVSRSG